MDSDKTSITKKEGFCASEFVNQLLEVGSKRRCDATDEKFNGRQLPPFYDREKFQRGQQFFHKHIFAMFYAKILGLITILTVPDLVHILKFTKMSGEPLTAYKRYLSTVFHMYVWYNEDFSPKSKIWDSIEKVKSKHDRASRQSYKSTQVFISQQNMALTQFGFMGFVVWKTKFSGIYGATRRELEDFIHIWRVIGNVMGMEDRFNICRESLEETREICKELVERVFKPNILKKRQDFLDMSNALLSGMWCMMPLFVHKPFIHILAIVLVYSSSRNIKNINNNDSRPLNKSKIEEIPDFNLKYWEKIYARLAIGFMTLFRFSPIRIFHQYVLYISLWLMNHFPFLAYYKFGRANSHVNI